MWLVWLLLVIGSYLLGSIPTAYVIVKWRTGQDIRDIGSGNVGATNAVRAVGWYGYLAFVGDVLKGLLPVVAARALGGPEGAAAAGFCALMGHFFPIWLQFHGGKGVSTAFGVYLGLTPLLALAGILFWAVLVLLSGYISLSSCAAVLLCPLLALAFHLPFACYWLYMMMGVMITMRHSSNFRRLLQGNERRSKFYWRSLLNN